MNIITNCRVKTDSNLTPLGKSLICNAKSPIVFALDVTGSMGVWPKVIWDKLPMFYGQIMIQGYLEDPAISFAAIGDAIYDRAPLQVTEFAQGVGIDDQLKKIWLEGGGGPNSFESYELAAYYYLHKVTYTQHNMKPFIFFTGDEVMGEKITKAQALKTFGDTILHDITSSDLFHELRNKYHVFYLHKTVSSEPSVVTSWKLRVGVHNVIEVKEPKAVVDVMLGCIALVTGKRGLDDYVNGDMKGRGQDESRCQFVATALSQIRA